ncbi:hypothetical protein GCM10022396_28820 [Flavivirga amylovorans]
MTILGLSCSNDDGPVNVAPTVSTQSFNANEGVLDTDVLGKVVAQDPDGDTLNYSITTNSDNLFEISTTGDLSLILGKTLDYEVSTSHTLTVEVSDGALKANSIITINVINDNEAPVVAPQNFSIDENSASGVLIGTLVASDPDGDSLVFSIIGSSFPFEINNSGEISLAVNSTLNFEQKSSYTLEIVTSDNNLQTSTDIIININDVNDAPNIGTTVFTVAEDIDDTFAIGGIPTSDEDRDTLIFSLGDTFASRDFEISSLGIISLKAGSSLDYETNTFHNFPVRVSDGTITISRQVTVYVTDVDDTP